MTVRSRWQFLWLCVRRGTTCNKFAEVRTCDGTGEKHDERSDLGTAADTCGNILWQLQEMMEGDTCLCRNFLCEETSNHCHHHAVLPCFTWKPFLIAQMGKWCLGPFPVGDFRLGFSDRAKFAKRCVFLPALPISCTLLFDGPEWLLGGKIFEWQREAACSVGNADGKCQIRPLFDKWAAKQSEWTVHEPSHRSYWSEQKEFKSTNYQQGQQGQGRSKFWS